MFVYPVGRVVEPATYQHSIFFKPIDAAAVDLKQTIATIFMPPEIAGAIVDVTQQEAHIAVKTQHAHVLIWVYSATIIRVNISRLNDADNLMPSFSVIQNPLQDINFTQTDDELVVNAGQLVLRISKKPLRLNFYNKEGVFLSGDDSRFGTIWEGDKVTSFRQLHPDERFIGLGEKTGSLNRRGQSFVNWNTDAVDYGIKTDPLYKTFPFFIGVHAGGVYGFFLDNTHKTFFDFGASTDQSMYWLGAEAGPLDYYFFGAATVAGIISDYTWLTGRMEMPPLWSLGYQQCRWSYMSADELLHVARNLRRHKIPADVLYCDIDYMDGYKIFTWDKKTFPDPEQLIRQLANMGFRLVTIVDPGIKIETGYRQYDEGLKEGYFATYINGELYTGEVWPGRCHFPDFFNEQVSEWWGQSFSALTNPGVSGFWNDMNEPAAWGQNIPSIVQFGSKPLARVRNVYGLQMSRATYNGTRQLLKNKRPFVLTRAAYAGIQRYSAVWTGDNTATDAHMLLGARLVTSLGITGVSFTGVDIGGFSGNPTPRLMVRWNSLGVYTPMFRNHAMMGTIYREPWKWGSAYKKIIRKDIEQRYRLLPYIYSSFYQSNQDGLPVCRMLAIEHSTDRYVYHQSYQNQFMFGNSLLVAPVESTVIKAKVYLPQGTWYRLSTDELFKGKRITEVDAPLTDLPVFVRAGGIIPMQSVIQSTGHRGDDLLQLHIWNSDKPASFIYYEDDGISYDYEKGGYYKRTINFNPRSQQINLSVVEGSFISKFKYLLLVLHGFDTISQIKVNNGVVKFAKRIKGYKTALINDEVQIRY